MKRTTVWLAMVLAALMLLPAGMANAQETAAQETAAQETPAAEAPPGEEDLEASAAAAKAGEQAEAEEQENRRRRFAPKETKIDLGEEKSIRVTAIAWAIDGKDYPNVATLEAGKVLQITASAPAKLWTHTDLTFGDLVVKAGNVAESYPGVYGLWFRKTDDGWALIFNNKPDVWGTMYDAAADAGEVPLAYETVADGAGPFTVTFEEADGGQLLVMTWGEHRWSTPFTHGG